MSRLYLTTFSVICLLLAHSISSFKITGAPGGIDTRTQAPPVRLEINEFATSGPAFDLFILALQELQAVEQSNPLSYFQIAGIHGYPSVPWDNVTGTGTYPGYCLHASVAFPLWHRPYLALFEQVLWQHAQLIARNYPPSQRTIYQVAALSMRVPYWDWAVNPSLPTVVTTPSISVNGPNGWHEIKNPLYRYDFHPGPEGNQFPSSHPLANASFTTRWSDPQLQQSSESTATSTMLSNAASLHSMTYQLLASMFNYTEFSCTWPGGHTNGANNIENIHNGVHNYVGGPYGSMTFPEMAAFDPIFWLHHAQVDRLVAMWQELNPSSYIVPTINAYGSYFEPQGTIDSDDSSLAPFHSDDSSTMFTPGTARAITTFGYTYPELANMSGNASAQQAILRAKINDLYNPINNFQSKKLRVGTERVTSVAKAFSCVTLQTAQELDINNLDRQWSVRVMVDRYACNKSFSIDFFMGPPPVNVTDWAMARNLIGTYSPFVASDAAFLHHSRNPREAQGEISMTHTLAAGVARGFLASLSPKEIIPLLTDHFQWRARTQDDQEVKLDRFSSLSILIQSRAVIPSNSSDEFPVYGHYQTHMQITNGRSERRW